MGVLVRDCATSVWFQPLCAMLPVVSQSHQMDMRIGKVPGSSSRILYDIPCRVCQDHSSGKHYGIFACDGCAGFFKRSIRRSRQYVCKAKTVGSCLVDKTHRNQCRACRLTKCVEAGMNKEAVQHERGPRNSTIRRQMSQYFKDPCDTTTDIDLVRSRQPGALDLAMPKSSASEEPDSSRHLFHPTAAAAFLAAQALMPKLGMQFPFPTSSTETVCESAARLLFMNVQWAKSVPAFTRLPYKDQLLLLEESWRELFVLGAAQFLLPIELAQLLSVHAALSPDPENSSWLQEVHVFQDTLLKFKQLHVDAHEYACLRAIVLFKTCFDGTGPSSSAASTSSNEMRCLIGAADVSALQDATQATLSKYISTAHPTQPFRFGKLLLLLPALRAVSASTIEELFFRRTIGHIPIERIICDMYKAKDL